MQVRKIEVDFNQPVELTNEDQRRLDRLLGEICARYTDANPGRIMWPFGSGYKMLSNPLMFSDDEPIPFDDEVYHVECAEREGKRGERSRFSRPTEMFQDIAAFHVKYGLTYNGPPRWLPPELDAFRTMFMAEELAEYVTNDLTIQKEIIQSVQRGVNIRIMDMPPSKDKQLDALVDLVYVALGTAYMHGFDFDEAWRRVHAANMQKARVTKDTVGPRGEAKYDVVKPPGWTAPDLSDLVQSSQD